MKTYAAIYNNDDIRKDSSSGGVFSALADMFEVVYGVAMTKDCYGAEFIRVENNDITSLRGSKYLQAKVGNALKQVKEDLNQEKKVLFSGTGCQINGLKCFLGKEYENLVCVDVICHGTPSPKLWREYVAYQESKNGKLEDVNFRCKNDGWKDFCMKKNQLFISKGRDMFMRMFLRDYCLRPACYECHAKYLKKSDITIADFWGIKDVAPEMDDGMGTSLVITRTDKGQELFEQIKEKLKWKEVSYEEGVRGNPSEYKSVARPEQRDTFFIDMNSMTFKKLVNKYLEGPLWKRIGRKGKRVIQKSLMHCGTKEKANVDFGMLLTFQKGK